MDLTERTTEHADWIAETIPALLEFAAEQKLRRVGKPVASDTAVVLKATSADGVLVTVIGPRPDLAHAEIEAVSGWPVSPEAKIAFETAPRLNVYLVGRSAR